MAPDDSPNTAINAAGQQAGDQSFRDTAGESIYNGVNPDRVFDLVRYFWEDRQERDIRREQLDHTLQDLRDAIELYRITLAQRIEAVRTAVVAQDTDLAALRRGQATARRWLAGLTLALVLVLAVVAILVWREAAALAVRAAYDAAVAGRR